MLRNYVKKAINKMIDFEAFGWPPTCCGTMYQPERPLDNCVAEDEDERFVPDSNDPTME